MKITILTKLLWNLVVGLMILLMLQSHVLAAPSGRIASTMFDGPLGKVLLILFTIVFLPLLTMRFFKTRRLSRKAFSNLMLLAKKHSEFEWLMLKQTAQSAFQRVHQAWTAHDLALASDYMSEEFATHQQLTYLDDWERRGLRNVCKLNKITKTFPVLVVHRNECGKANNQSIVVLYISAEMQDYLEDKSSGEIIEGNDKYKDVSSLWTFTLSDGKWKVTNIEPAGLLEDYLDIAKQQPPLTPEAI